jgi:hypothetical protein
MNENTIELVPVTLQGEVEEERSFLNKEKDPPRVRMDPWLANDVVTCTSGKT